MRSNAFIVLGLISLLLVPVRAQELLDYPLDTVQGEEVYRYEVERSIGIYRIGVNFGVSQSEIIRLNPQLKERGLRFGDTLLIPTGRKVELKQPEAPQPTTPPVHNIDSMAHAVIPDSANLANYTYPANTTELALMLPFESMQTKRSANAERMMDFYQGALLALHDMQSDSVRLRLRVYDTERSERRVNALCEGQELDHVQGILGLAYPIQIERITEWCEVHKVPLLLPFSDDIDLSDRPYILQFNSTDRQEADSLCEWLVRNEVHCIAVETQEADIAESVRTLRKQMQEHEIACSSVPLRDLLIDSAAYALDSTRENIIVLHSDKYQHVRILLPHLVKLQDAGYKLRIISQYSWQKEDIQLPQIYTSMFTAEGNNETYETLWNTYFSAEHVSVAPRFDLLGYDLMHALISWLQGEKELSGLQSDIRWTQIGDGGWQNAQVQVVIK